MNDGSRARMFVFSPVARSEAMGLPKGMVKRNGVYHASLRLRGISVRRSLSRNLDEAKRLLDELRFKECRMTDDEFHEWARTSAIKRTSVYVYFIEAVGLGCVKIGKAHDVSARLRELQCGSASELRVISFYEPGKGADLTEQFLHRAFSKFRIAGRKEWFELSGEIRAFAENPTDQKFADLFREKANV